MKFKLHRLILLINPFSFQSDKLQQICKTNKLQRFGYNNGQSPYINQLSYNTHTQNNSKGVFASTHTLFATLQPSFVPGRENYHIFDIRVIFFIYNTYTQECRYNIQVTPLFGELRGLEPTRLGKLWFLSGSSEYNDQV